MPTYVYGCSKNIQDHPRIEIAHGMHENPVLCCEICGASMRRIPQSVRVYFNPGEILTEWMDENYKRYRARKKGKKAPRFSPDNVMKPGAGIPAKYAHTRRRTKS